MLENKYIKIFVLTGAFVLAIVFTLLRLDLDKSVKTGVASTLLNTETKVGTGSENSDIDENTSRVYFSIFRFISNLVPTGSSN
jgi:hypothetical protein